MCNNQIIEDDINIDDTEMVITKLGSLVSMMHSDENINNISFMIKIAENKSLTKVLMLMLESNTLYEACYKLLYYNSKTLNSKILKNHFVELMKKQVDSK